MQFALPAPHATLTHILVADADAAARKLLRKAFTDERFQVSEASTGALLRKQLTSAGIGLITLDVDMPDQDGFDLLREIVATTAVPVVVVSARAKTIDKVRCFEAGAIDHLAKPFDSDELVARVRSILRRTQRYGAPDPVAAGFDDTLALPFDDTVTFDGWSFDIAGQHLETPSRTLVSLTGMESSLLAIFVRRPRKLLSREDIKMALHGGDVSSDIRAIDVMVKKLRAKLAVHAPETEFIKTQRGAGYFFAAKVLPVR